MLLECTITGRTSKLESLPADLADRRLSATRNTHHRSQKSGPVSLSLALRFCIRSSTGEFNGTACYWQGTDSITAQ